jgi:YaiO family outer membrane protein
MRIKYCGRYKKLLRAMVIGLMALPVCAVAQNNPGAPAAAVQESPSMAPSSSESTAPSLAKESNDEEKPTSYVEVGGAHYWLTNQYNNWNRQYVSGVYQQSLRTHWNWESSRLQEFGETGYFFVGGATHDFSPNWYADANVGSSAGGYFLPSFRTDDFIHKKWMAKRPLVTTFGAGYDHAKDEHRDYRLFAGAVYYFEHPWVIESGMTLNISTPGNVYSHQNFVALTQGKDKKRYITLRGALGTEGYQVIGPNSSITDFASHDVSLTLRQWVVGKWGFNLLVDHYGNQYYQRTGAELGLFREF